MGSQRRQVPVCACRVTDVTIARTAPKRGTMARVRPTRVIHVENNPELSGIMVTLLGSRDEINVLLALSDLRAIEADARRLSA